jgi:beta-phosphoglucomutase
MNRWPRAVLFDFDGVLVNSEPLHLRAYQEVLRAEQIGLTEAEYYDELLGFDDKGAFRQVFEKRGLELRPKVFLSLMANKSRVMMNLIQSKSFQGLPGVEAFVRGLWRDRPLAICSGGLREEIEAMLEGIGLRDCFGVITAAEDVAVGKPDPQGYLQTMEKVAEKLTKPLKPADCLVIEDAPAVIRSVKKAGFPVLAVATSHFASGLSDADWVVKSLEPAEVKRVMPNLPLRD